MEPTQKSMKGYMHIFSSAIYLNDLDASEKLHYGEGLAYTYSPRGNFFIEFAP